MTFAVTGGAGLVGSHIVRRLVSDGHNVTVIDDMSRGSMTNLEGVYNRINFVRMDILDRGGLKEALCGADGIFHQAALAYVPGSYRDGERYRQVNVAGSENVFQMGLELGIRVVHASSSTVYGDVRRPPVREDCARRPINPYGVTKLGAELSAERYAKRGAQIVVLRYFNVIGRGRRPAYSGVVYRFLEQLENEGRLTIHGDGSQIKDFVFIHDVVRANLAAMMAGGVRSGFFNIGSGRPISVEDLAHMMTRMYGGALKPRYADRRPGDARMCVAEISKAGRLLGWRPGISLEDGLPGLLPARR